ncbi:lysozyme inhibitor LprI family protein [Brucella anthropi]|uniref:lysozyme inhibitor LprI family protein n=1 Tax=Brucella anthropi TaxID=529 RepID=UPI000CFDA7C0|nr:lysozyme inhibitor LprI family protein [Ochrobactrum sp. MYb49]PQZ61789.1 hypothetical protein CQ057_22695 [Ochrobactrum sp. MYb49]
MGKLPASSKNQLKESQRNWIRYRDSECRYQQVSFSIMVSEADCKETLTRQRTALLRQQLVWLKQGLNGPSAESCDAELGKIAAQNLVNQCKDISPATHPPCNSTNSCQMIRDEIARGCRLVGADMPDFCK